jgi:hypothetical protein
MSAVEENYFSSEQPLTFLSVSSKCRLCSRDAWHIPGIISYYHVCDCLSITAATNLALLVLFKPLRSDLYSVPCVCLHLQWAKLLTLRPLIVEQGNY